MQINKDRLHKVRQDITALFKQVFRFTNLMTKPNIDYTDFSTDGQKSEFHSSLSILNRLNASCALMNMYQRTGSLLEWYKELQVYFKELAKHMTKETYEEYKTKIDNISKEIPQGVTNQDIIKKYWKSRDILINNLMKIEVELGRFQEEKGLGMKMTDDPFSSINA